VKKLQRISGKNTWLPGQGLNPGPPEHEAVLVTQPQSPQQCVVIACGGRADHNCTAIGFLAC